MEKKMVRACNILAEKLSKDSSLVHISVCVSMSLGAFLACQPNIEHDQECGNSPGEISSSVSTDSVLQIVLKERENRFQNRDWREKRNLQTRIKYVHSAVIIYIIQVRNHLVYYN